MKASSVNTMTRWLLPAIAITLLLVLLFKAMSLQAGQKGNGNVKSFPAFELKDLQTNKSVTQKSLLGKSHIVHVWASWCGPCLNEHKLWVKVKKKWPNIDIVSITYRDEPSDVLAFLKRGGNPYKTILNDQKGQLGIALGIIGTPETFLVDPQGNIIAHQVGSLEMSQFEKQFLPKLINE